MKEGRQQTRKHNNKPTNHVACSMVGRVVDKIKRAKARKFRVQVEILNKGSEKVLQRRGLRLKRLRQGHIWENLQGEGTDSAKA